MAATPFELPALEAPPVSLAVPVAVAAPAPDAGPAPEAVRAAAHAEGFAAGLDEGTAVIADAVRALHQAAAELGAQRETIAAAAERAAVDLGLRIAEHALAGALQVQPERVVDVARGALRRLVDRDRVTILVHPDDLETVRAASGALVAELGGMEHCEVQADRRVGRGGAVVRTVDGEVDATLDAKLARARDVVVEELAGE